MKIVINSCYGGFRLSAAALARYMELCENPGPDLGDGEIARDDPVLVQVVEELGRAAGGPYSELIIVNVPEGVDWQIDEYDGREWVAERHRRWYS